MKDLPPLKAVRAFEACYRLRSFTQAAAALNVGQPAISHQIRQLERDLGVKLFEKKGARILPTSAAHTYYEAVASGLGEIASASAKLREQASDRGLVLATYPGIATFWALPRIESIQKSRGNSGIRVVTADRDAEVSLKDCDCAIMFGRDGQWSGYEAVRLIGEEVVAVASPQVAEQWQDAPVEALLQNGPLIGLEDPEARWVTWEGWRNRFAPDVTRLNYAMTVTNHGIALSLALMGRGIALGWSGVIADLLGSGTLVALDYQPLVTEAGYYLIAPPAFARSERYQALLQVLTQ